MSACSDSGGESGRDSGEGQHNRHFRSIRVRPSAYCVHTSPDVEGVDSFGTEHNPSWPFRSNKLPLGNEVLSRPRNRAWLEMSTEANPHLYETLRTSQPPVEPRQSPGRMAESFQAPPRKFKLRQKSASEANSLRMRKSSQTAGAGGRQASTLAERQTETSTSRVKTRYVSSASHSSDESLTALSMGERTRLAATAESNMSSPVNLLENRRSSARRLQRSSPSFSSEMQGRTNSPCQITLDRSSHPQLVSVDKSSNKSIRDSETSGYGGSQNCKKEQGIIASQAESRRSWNSSPPVCTESPQMTECLRYISSLRNCSSETQLLTTHLQQAETSTEALSPSQSSVLPTHRHGCFGANTQQVEQTTLPSSSLQMRSSPSMTQPFCLSQASLQDLMMLRQPSIPRQRRTKPRTSEHLDQDSSSATVPVPAKGNLLSLTPSLLPRQHSVKVEDDSERISFGNGPCKVSQIDPREHSPPGTSSSRRAVSPIPTARAPMSKRCLSSSSLPKRIPSSYPGSEVLLSKAIMESLSAHAAPHPASTVAEACEERLHIALAPQRDLLDPNHQAITRKTFSVTATALPKNTLLSDKSDGPRYGETSRSTTRVDTSNFLCTMTSDQNSCHSWRGGRRSRQSPGQDPSEQSAAIDPQCATDRLNVRSEEGAVADHSIRQSCQRSRHRPLEMETDNQRITTASTVANITSFKISQSTSASVQTLPNMKPGLRLATTCQSREREDMDTMKSIQKNIFVDQDLVACPHTPKNAYCSRCEVQSPQTPDQYSAESSPVSPYTGSSPAGRHLDSDDDGYETPMTSVESSPIKCSRPTVRHLPRLTSAQLDGANDSTDGKAVSCESEVSEAVEDAIEFFPDDETPLVPPNPAKAAYTLRDRWKRFSTIGSSTPQRHPSALLRHCERSATPRQRKLMSGGLRSPDRFISSRATTPTKVSFTISKRNERSSASDRYGQPPVVSSDPFAPASRRTLRMTDRYATLRGPAPSVRPVGRTNTLVADGQRPGTQAVSEGAIWTVGSTLVTKGVPSTPNGRGGRLTSGTSAPHYTADFLRKASAHDEEDGHRRRLALAIGMDQNARLLDHSSPVSTRLSPSSEAFHQATSSARVWRDGVWERESPISPTKNKVRKIKDVPVIPFRVLDAPALRDDYYCSLLAYSPTLDCLAVGLGPHVYLWCEDRQRHTSKLPDSLTAPLSAHITSLSFSSPAGGSAVLAIGRADGRITLWSPLDRDPRFDSEQPSAVSFVCFRPNTVRRQSIHDNCTTVATEELLVGDETGNVYLYSVEWPDQDQRDLFDWHGSMTLLGRISCHSQQVCGIAWSLDGEFFATGGNDNQLFLFESKKIVKHHRRRQDAKGSEDTVKVRSGDQDTVNSVAGQGTVLNIVPGHQKHIFTLNAAVRALAFAPWQPSLLAAGGGSNDRCIHFFHTTSGARLATIDCHAQVTSLIWSEKRKEIAATFGFAQPEHKIRVAVFSWPSCRCVVRIPWVAEERALHSVAYPRGPAGGMTGQQTTDDREGGPWYGKRTREEGCLVVATSDASIKFHEVWAERDGTEYRSPVRGPLGGSQILEGNCSSEVEGWGTIR